MKLKQLRIEVLTSDPMAKQGLKIVTLHTTLDPYRDYKMWLEAIKKIHRPIWVDP